MVHYAEGLKSEEVRKKYRQDPKTDYHRMVQEWTGLEKQQKLNLGTIYEWELKRLVLSMDGMKMNKNF